MIARSNFLEQSRNLITPGLVGPIAAALGADQRLVSRGAEVALNLITLAMARQAASMDGAARVWRLVSSADATVLVDLPGYIERYRPGDGEPLRAAVLGPGQGAIFASIFQATGRDLGPLTALLTPVGLALLGTIVWEQRADTVGLARLLLGQAERASDSGSPAARIASAALAAGAAQARLLAPVD